MKAKDEEISDMTLEILEERNNLKKKSKISERLALRYRKLHPM
ncbi:hypothetical protein TELCIR_10694 [Teladorsagia circumcincta]|uniref:Uncharacterized protein n=1 Tax=Teladorsagia circumcincta TaxID=45464 RepID=A0A2G9UBC7_TELCI|nr:hypothetical protein TELCIR_10694 [Teladorsagia circumcincta]